MFSESELTPLIATSSASSRKRLCWVAGCSVLYCDCSSKKPTGGSARPERLRGCYEPRSGRRIKNGRQRCTHARMIAVEPVDFLGAQHLSHHQPPIDGSERERL